MSDTVAGVSTARQGEISDTVSYRISQIQDSTLVTG